MAIIKQMTVNSVEKYFYNDLMKDYFNEGKLYSLQLEINTACGQGCKYCYVQQTVPQGTKMSRNFVLSVVDQVGELGVQTIEWLGGDPLRHPNFWEFINRARSLELTNNIWSTGDKLANPKLVEFLLDEENQGIVSFHLDTLDRRIYEQLSSSPPDFINTILSNVNSLIDEGVKPSRLYNCMTFTKLQAGADFKKTVKTLYERFGIISGIVPYKHVVNIPQLELLTPSSKDIFEALSFRSTLMYDERLPVTPQCVSKFYCGTTCSLTVTGDITPCTRIRHSLAKVERNDFTSAFEQERAQLLKMPLRADENLPVICRDCENNSICWGCRGNAWYYGNDFLGKDPKCWHHHTEST